MYNRGPEKSGMGNGMGTEAEVGIGANTAVQLCLLTTLMLLNNAIHDSNLRGVHNEIHNTKKPSEALPTQVLQVVFESN